MTTAPVPLENHRARFSASAALHERADEATGGFERASHRVRRHLAEAIGHTAP